MASINPLRFIAERLRAHVRVLWGNYWFLPLLPTVYAGGMVALGNLRLQHIIAALAAITLGYSTRFTKRCLVVAFPALLIIAAYDVLHYAQPIFVVPQRILGCQMRNIELALFAQAPNVTLQDYFAVHHRPFWDLYFAVPYGIFFYVLIAYGAYLLFIDEVRARRFVWAIALSYPLAMTMWLAVPVAPPWYIRAHGCVIDISAAASAAGLVRVDHLLGTRYFEAFYAQSPAIFAAFPSMHCAFPVIGLLTAWRQATWMTRPIHLLYAASMFAGSIYLDHHWTTDGIAGWLLAALAVFGARMIVPLRPQVS